MKRFKLYAIAFLVAALLMSPTAVLAAGKKEAQTSVTKRKPYPLGVCVVSDEKLGSMGKPHFFIHEGREVMLCCDHCKEEFDAATAKYVAKIDEAAKKVVAYPLKKCLVSGEKLNNPKKTYVFVHDFKEIKLCCDDCRPEFEKEMAKYMAKLDKAHQRAAKKAKK